MEVAGHSPLLTLHRQPPQLLVKLESYKISQSSNFLIAQVVTATKDAPVVGTTMHGVIWDR